MYKRQCPYRYFVDYGLRPLEVQEFEEQFADVGTYIHDIMDRLSREFERERIDWAQADDAQIKCAVNKAADEAMKGHNRGIFSEKRFAFMEKRLREEAALAARAARSQLCGTAVKVKASEMDFSGGELTPETAVGQLVLRGRIDRIDEAEIDGNTYIRVVDYKTMDKKFNLTDPVSYTPLDVYKRQVGGLIYATLLTLYVVPALYDIMNKRPPKKIEIDTDKGEDVV